MTLSVKCTPSRCHFRMPARLKAMKELKGTLIGTLSE